MNPVEGIERWWRRWHLIGAGVDNVWHYTREVLPCPSGRWLARGPNGTGKTTLLEGLCPYLLNPAHHHLSSASGRSTSLVSLMKGGSTGRRRFGYMWLSFGPPGDPASGDADAGEQHYGLRLEYAQSNNSVETAPFRLPVVPGHDGSDLSTMSLEDFCAWVETRGGEVFASTDAYVADLAQRVFGCGPAALKRIARHIRKVRNPGLLTGLSPAEAAAELRKALPTVSPEVVKATQEALAAAETTRRCFERDAKTAQLFEGLAAAWAHAAARAGAQAVDAALACATALAKDRAEADQARTNAETRVRDLDELRVSIQELMAAERQTSERAKALARDAASSDMAHARAEVARNDSAHEKDCELLTVRAEAAARAAGDVQDAVGAVSELTNQVARSCRAALVPVALAAAVTVRRGEKAPLRIGERVFQQAPRLEVVVDESAAGQAVEQLQHACARLERRGEDAEAVALAYRDVEGAQEESVQARRLADAAASAAQEAAARHQETLEHAQEQVVALSDRVQGWARTVRGQCRTPHLDAGMIAAQARGWSDGRECSGVVHDAGRLARKVALEAEASSVHARTRAERHAGLAEQAQKAAAEAAERARRLGSGELLPLPAPSWHHGGDEERAFACAVEWTSPDAGAGALRDVAEAVMAAAGLLSAELTELGADGHGRWLVHPRGEALPERQSMASVLRAVPGHPLQEVTARVLERIAYLPSAVGAEADRVAAGLVVGADGTFRAGVMTGRLPVDAGEVPRASHIGAGVRQAAALRAAAQAQAECDHWNQQAMRHERAAHRMTLFADTVQELTAQFPHDAVAEADRAETTRAEASRAGHTADAHASQQDRIAQDKESSHRAALGRWRHSAVALGLPDTLSAVEQEAQEAKARAAGVRAAADNWQGLGRLLKKVREAAVHAQAASQRAEQAVRTAQASYAEVLAANAALDACRQRSGMDELALTEAADAALKAHQDTQERLAQARSRMEGVAGRAGDARRAEDEAVRRVERAVPTAEASLARVRGLLAFDALRELLGGPAKEPGEDMDASGWLTELRGRLRAVPAPATPLEDCAAAVRAHLASEDDDWQLGHGQAPEGLPTHQLTLTGYQGMSPPAAAHHAAALLEAAQAAYDTAEDQALQKFVLGHIPTAISTAWVDLHTWVKNINTQMKLARASSGVLVQLKVRLAPDLTPSRAAIHHLTCEVGDADRTPEQQHSVGQELLAVMRQGEEGGATDRATRLAEAIDIRNWVTVQYVIVREDGTQEQWGKPQTTVSGGESRLIVLAPMLAALAAEYRDLPAHALRLCALDEVPGEVDEAGRDGIAQYTASLDLDLMCTSHHWDGSPGAWDGIDIHDLAKSSTGVIIAEPMHLYSDQLLAATGHLPAQNTGPTIHATEVTK
ncbi:SbcC/MukB-like Walker B domain-containing protein [Streptomyces angustmyceticus]|uniref:SbcC/MukB-like Walker B domain-containing protein n=1 Tax=Streptomyces angustmyceticus TaxID=285578 RepID=UPI0021AF171F|nr:SbcC/MukB-like Walker B domain-containing protein [Streptomyces angustmyceticus]